MSLNNITKENNYKLYCNSVKADKFDVGEIVVDNITVQNANVINTISTSHINSGTSLFNTIVTSNLDTNNANIINLNSTNGTINGLKANTLQTVTGLGNITSTNNIIAPVHVATTSVNTPSIINGALPVAVSTGITFPNTNAAGTTNLRYYLQSTGTLTTSGAVVTSLNYRATRIGGQVNVCVQAMDTSVLATANTFLKISGMPIDFLPNSTTCCGPILTNTTAGATMGRYQFNGSGDILIFATVNSGVNFLIGQPCGLFGGTAQFATFTFSRTP